MPEHLRTALEAVLSACVDEVPSLEPIVEASQPKHTRQVGVRPSTGWKSFAPCCIPLSVHLHLHQS